MLTVRVKYSDAYTLEAWGELPISAIRERPILVDDLVSKASAALRIAARWNLVIPTVIVRSRVRGGMLDVSVSGREAQSC